MAPEKEVNQNIDTRENRVGRNITPRYQKGVSALQTVINLVICDRPNDIDRFLNMQIPTRFRPLKNEASDWVGFSDFQNEQVRLRVEGEIAAGKPEEYTVVSETDLNNFKVFNDSFGLDVGDGVIGNSAIVYANLLEEKITDIPNVDIYRGPGDEVMTIGRNLTKNQGERLVKAIKETEEELKYSGKKDISQPIPFSVTCTAFTKMVHNKDFIDGTAESEFWKQKGTKAREEYTAKGNKISYLDIAFGLMEETKGISKASALVRDFNKFKGSDFPGKLSHFEGYINMQARQSHWMRDLYVVFQDVRGKLETIVVHPIVQVGVNSGNLEEIIAMYMLNDGYNKRLVNRLTVEGVIDMNEVDRYLTMGKNESLSSLDRVTVRNFEMMFLRMFTQFRRNRGTV